MPIIFSKNSRNRR